MKHLNNNEKTFEIGAIESLLNLIYAQMIGFFVAKECNFRQLFAFSRKWMRIFSIRCTYLNLLFNLLLVF